jgi:hypothetical protein
MGLADSISYSFADGVRECSIFGILRLVLSITVLERLMYGEKTTIGEVLERYSHEGYLIKVVVMALAGKITR